MSEVTRKVLHTRARRRPRGDSKPIAKPSAVGTHLVAGVFGAALMAVLFAAFGPRPRWVGEQGAALDPLRTRPLEYAWNTQPEPRFPIPPYARFLAGVTIVLDPGHGGDAHIPNYKRGPTGLREAEVNLRVARFLREFLESAGAGVSLTRDDDIALDPTNAIDLQKRIGIANRMRADLFLSIHHNAAEKPEINYTSVYYHGDPDDSPASLSAARNLAAGLADALRLDQHIECAVVSDFSIYPRDGFAVLRQAQVPAVLSEASFHSSPSEEQRLRDPLYNRREAYGLFLGLARWAQGGLPRVELLDLQADRNGRGRTARLRLHDGLRERGGFGSNLPKILESSIRARASSAALSCSYESASGVLRVSLPSSSTRDLVVDFANIYGQHVLHPLIELRE